jgi:hypothetical protein
MTRLKDVCQTSAIVFGLAAALPSLAAAQAVQASITGLVRDSTGLVLPGATVEASSEALIEKVRTTISDEQGLYRITDLRPGLYTVTFTLTGFSTVRREGIELTPGFVATINADLRVGAVEETVTVTGASPVVDVQSTTQQSVLSRDLLDSLPTGKTIQAYATLTPGIVIPATAQDVGGNQGELAIAMGIHGNRSADMKLLQDGLRFNSMEGTAGGAGRGFYVNAASAQEVSLETSGTSAESETGGIMLNVIPKEGGNRFRGYFFSNYTNGSLQNDNLSQEHIDRGLLVVNSIDKIWDLNAAVGGPIMQDTLWFYTAHRHYGNYIKIANNFENATPTEWYYTPDLSRQAIRDDVNRSHNLRLTWQLSQKNKLNLSYELQDNCVCHTGLNAQVAPEAVVRWRFHPNYLITATWNSPRTNRLLIEAAGAVLNFDWPNLLQEGVTPDRISVLDQSLSYRYRSAASSYGNKYTPQANQRFSISYVTGTHHFKTGTFTQQGYRRHVNNVNGDVNYRFTNRTPTGVPNLITMYATPLVYTERLNINFGAYAQDQWTMNRLTLNLGIRYDYVNAKVPDQHLDAGRFVPRRDFAEVPCVPCWTDINPRFGLSYDLFGNGKTAIKGTYGRYVVGVGVDQARLNNPVVTTVQTATRTWTDNGNFIPEGDFSNPNANGEIGRLSDLGFGQTRVLTRYSDEVMQGFGNRGSNWQASVSVQHELRPSVAVNVGYFRTWYGNFRTTDNQLTTSADFDPYFITAPVDARLPGGGGYRVDGLYNVSVAKFGLNDDVVVKSERFGEQTEVYNGFDFTLNARLSQGMLSGGLTTGKTVADGCFVVDSPQALRFCRNSPPWAAGTQLKLFGVYNLPWQLQASGTYQNIPGIPVQANYTATNAEIRPSLGRDLSAGANANVSVPLIEPNTMFEERINQFDARLTKNFTMSGRRLEVMLDVYNVFNASPILSTNNTYGPAWQRPNQILDGRLFKFGVQLDF